MIINMETEKKIIDNSEINNSEIEEKDNKEIPLELEIAKKELEEWKNKYIYLLADLENAKKRYNKAINDAFRYREENFFNDLLVILDDFDNIRKFINENTDDNDKKAILLIHTKLFDLLRNYELTKIYDKEHPIYFNEDTDEAVLKIDVDDPQLDNTISEVVKFGYKYKDKILRYEQVVVNKYAEKNEEE